MNILDEAYSVLFGRVMSKTDVRESWEKARSIRRNFSVPKLGERLALAVLCEIALYVHFPNSQMARLYAQWATGIIKEILGIHADYDFGEAELIRVGMCLDKGETVEETKAHWVPPRFFRN